MFTRFCIIIAALTMVSGCIATPRFEMVERIEFNYVPMSQQTMGYSDMLCCAACKA